MDWSNVDWWELAQWAVLVYLVGNQRVGNTAEGNSVNRVFAGIHKKTGDLEKRMENLESRG